MVTVAMGQERIKITSTFQVWIFGFFYISCLGILPALALEEFEIDGVYQDCQLAQQRSYFPTVKGRSVSIDCQKNFIHYYSHPSKARDAQQPARRKMQWAAFNLWHLGNAHGFSPLGDGQTPFKNYALLAEIMNQWDLVAAVEMNPLGKLDEGLNKKFDLILAQPNTLKISSGAEKPVLPMGESLQSMNQKKWLDLIRANYIVPGHIQLLNALRKLDPDWSLILSAQGLGRPTADGTYYGLELAGFFYRSSQLRPVATEFCPDTTSACLLPIPQALSQHFERLPFVTSFAPEARKGEQFTAMAVHLRYGLPADSSVVEMLEKTSPIAGFKLPQKKEGGYSKANMELWVRFAEMKILADRLADLRKKSTEKDIFLMGDFNLEWDEAPPLNAAWAHAMDKVADHAVYVHSGTTVPFSKASSRQNYDHFIFDPALNQFHCLGESAQEYDFTAAENSSAIDAFRRGSKKERDRLEQSLMSALKVDAKKVGTLVRRYKPDLVQKVLDYFDETLAGKAGEFQIHRNLFSDHLPIYMTCEF